MSERQFVKLCFATLAEIANQERREAIRKRSYGSALATAIFQGILEELAESY